MKRAELAARMGGRILESVLSYKDVSNLVYEGLDFHMDCIQIFPNMLEKAQEVRAGRDLPLCAVISYPHGTFTAEQKEFEIHDAIASGADQVEVVINMLNVHSGMWDMVRKEMESCRRAAGAHILKFIIEMKFLKDEEIRRVCSLAAEAGVDRIVTSIGVYTYVNHEGRELPYLISPDDVRKIKDSVGDRVKIVAQGHVDSLEKTLALLDAGADYVSSEFAAQILRVCR